MSDENNPEGASADNEPITGFGDGPTRVVPMGKRRKKRRKVDVPTLSINSLMDIVTIILVYLLKSYATSPIDVKDPSLELPISTSKETVEDATVVMVTGPFRKTSDPTGRTVLIENQPALIVDNRPLFNLTAAASAAGTATWRIATSEKTPPNANSYVVTSLKAALQAARQKQEVTATINEREFSGKVVILADKRTPYRVLMDILVTCGQAGFGEFKFAIVKETG